MTSSLEWGWGQGSLRKPGGCGGCYTALHGKRHLCLLPMGDTQEALFPCWQDLALTLFSFFISLILGLRGPCGNYVMYN